MNPVVKWEAAPTHKVVRIFFDFTDLPPDLIGVICGYYNDWLEYEEIEELKNRVLEMSKNLAHLWWRTFNSYYNQKFMVDALRYYLAKNDNYLLLADVYKKIKPSRDLWVNYRTHCDIATYLNRINHKTLQYWSKREETEKKVSNNYRFRQRFREILNKEIINISNLEALFEDTYLMALELKIEDPRTTQPGKENCEREIDEMNKRKKEIKNYFKIKKTFETEILENGMSENKERHLYRVLNG